MNLWRTRTERLLFLLATVAGLAWSSGRALDWFGVLRTVMMVVGGLVVLGLVLVVSIAVISGIMGMIGKLRKERRLSKIMNYEL
jgi:hypothetical protein